MQRTEFHYELPEELIASYPLPERSASRLMCLDPTAGGIEDKQFTDLPFLLQENDLLVFNNTRVIPARVWGRKDSGGKIEVLVERVIGEGECLAHVRASKAPKAGARLQLCANPEGKGTDARATVVGREDDLYHLRFEDGARAMEVLTRIGHMPLPPYIERADEELDRERYQTVYGEREGAVAAPTAGLHFTLDLINACRARGVNTGFVTLHVGAGTFQPVRADDIEDHRMHAEYLEVDPHLCEQVQNCRRDGGRVVAVGTTAVRALETAAVDGAIKPYAGDSRLFIYPGYHFRCVDAMVTNFHLPESSLIMLVSAFAGHDFTLRAYREAVARRYRFFSYGDAMYIGQRGG